MTEMDQFQAYLQTMLTDTQIRVLAEAVMSQSTVCLYGAGLGKSTLARIFRNAGIHQVLAQALDVNPRELVLKEGDSNDES